MPPTPLIICTNVIYSSPARVGSLLSVLGVSRLCFPTHPKQDLNSSAATALGFFMLMQQPPFPRWIQKPKQTWRMSINISRAEERHRNIPNEQVNTALKEPFPSVPPPNTPSIGSYHGDDNYSWSAGYSNYCNKNHIKLVTTCVRQGLSLQLCTFPCPPPPFKVGCWVWGFLLQLCSKR